MLLTTSRKQSRGVQHSSPRRPTWPVNCVSVSHPSYLLPKAMSSLTFSTSSPSQFSFPLLLYPCLSFKESIEPFFPSSYTFNMMAWDLLTSNPPGQSRSNSLSDYSSSASGNRGRSMNGQLEVVCFGDDRGKN